MAASESSISPALDCLHRGELDSAREHCEALIRDEPGHPKAWHLLGIIHAQCQDYGAAIECFQTAIRHRGDVAAYHYNLALAWHRSGDCEQALGSYRAAVQRKPDFVDAQSNLGNCLVEIGDLAAAVSHFQRLAEQFPNESIVQYNLGNVLQDDGQHDACLEAFRRAIELDPDLSSARENLARALSDAERHEEAVGVWRDWLEREPDNALAKHMLAATSGESVPDRCDDDCVRATFDQNFSQNYDHQLRRIEYRVPELIRQVLPSAEATAGGLEVLDAGCGTGLCAEILRPLARRLVGVDLSADMLELAERRSVYDELHECELTEFLYSGREPFQLIVCGDTLCYFGRLEKVFGGFFRSLVAAGDVVFTVETFPADETPSGGQEKDFMLQPNGRYRHREIYVRRALADAALKVQCLSTETLRFERGREVNGLVVVARPA